MSYNGTVRCSHCYKTGHNKRKCPSLTEEIKGMYEGNSRMAVQEREAGNENDAQWYDERAEHYRQQYLKRTKIDLTTGEKVSNKAAKAARMKKVRCGYCGDRGHTRRTCEVVKRDKQVFIAETRLYRAAALEKARETGIGLNSIVPLKLWGYYNGEYGNHVTHRYIKRIDWNVLTARRPNLVAIHVDVRKLATANQAPHTSRDTFVSMANKMTEMQENSECAVPASLVPTLDPPTGWLEASPATTAEAMKEEFATSGSEKERNWRYKYPEAKTIEAIEALGLQEHYQVS